MKPGPNREARRKAYDGRKRASRLRRGGVATEASGAQRPGLGIANALRHARRSGLVLPLFTEVRGRRIPRTTSRTEKANVTPFAPGVSDLERGPDRQEEATGDQQEDDPSHPPAGFSSLSDGDNRVRSRGAGRFRSLVATRCLSASILFVEVPRRRGVLGSAHSPGPLREGFRRAHRGYGKEGVRRVRKTSEGVACEGHAPACLA
jgi:hypothetical protein